MTSSDIPFTAGPPETVLPPPDPEVADALARAEAAPAAQRPSAAAAVAAAHPEVLDAWALLAESTGDPVESYAYARVGYHRGLDALRASGWRGSGYVRWRHPSNAGFLRSLDALRAAAERLGETAEAERCATFLAQLDPDRDRRQEG